jgi:LuxR family transcriptional regulator, maltose regulon positive regulatory protein
MPILATKLYIPPPRAKIVLRPRLIEQLNAGLQRKLTLISAPAGFGKTTLVAEWIRDCGRPIAWLSLDEGDNDPARFLTYFIAALQTIAAGVGEGVLKMLQSPQPPSPEAILTTLVNDIAAIPSDFVLVLDDYHVIETKTVGETLTFLLEYLPPQMHLVIATREDPNLPLARLRVRDQLTELRVTDLRFTPSEAAGFLNQVMGLNLSTEAVMALENRTEGWIAGLQLAAISLQGNQEPATFIKSFTGSHRFVLDYLVEEVLNRQPENIQTFLLHTSILERLCASLCDAISRDDSGQTTLDYLERANLFIVPLDNERQWYRYHHLFADLLRQRLQQSMDVSEINELHRSASVWYEDNGLEIEAFHHATAAFDVERAERLIEGKGMPLHFRGAVAPVLHWLDSLTPAVLATAPSLWTAYASVLLVTGQTSRVEPTLQAAEKALQNAEPDMKTRDLIGRVAAIRATVAATLLQAEPIIEHSRRALEYLHPDNLPFRTSTEWKLGLAYQLQGKRAAARQTYTKVIATGKASGNMVFTIAATIGMGMLQEMDNQLHLACETYQQVLQVIGDLPLPIMGEVHLGLARIFYEWNDLETAQLHLQKSLPLARQNEGTDRFVGGEMLLARLKLAQGDVVGASTIAAKAGQIVRQHNFTHQMANATDVQVRVLLRQGHIAAAADTAQNHELSQTRVHLAQGDTTAALALLESLRHQMETKDWADERLKVMVLQAIALYEHGERDKALQVLGDVLAITAPERFTRIFVDEGEAMARLLSNAEGLMPDYVGTLLVIFESEKRSPLSQPLIEPLSERELDVLRLIAQGLSNHEISERLFLALSTVKGHNQRIFDKLQVQRRTEAVARARELGLL